MPLRLTDADLRSVQKAQRALFPSNDRPARGAWVTAAFPALCQLLRTDHVHYTEPQRSGLAAGHGRRAGTGTPAPALHVHSTAEDEGFALALNDYFAGFSREGFSQFRDPYMTLVRGLVRGAGAGAFHDGPLHDGARLAQSPLHQTVFRPHDVQRKMALSVPLPVGEAMLVAGFSENDAPSFDGPRHQLLRLLLPAFEAGLRYRLLVADRAAQAPTRLDLFIQQAPIPLLFYDMDGAERYRNRAFVRLAGAPTRDTATLPAAAQTLALQVLDDLRYAARPLQPVTTCARGTFWLRACPGVVVRGRQGVIVFVERAGAALPAPARANILPCAEHIQAATDLSPREADVARHVAEGKTDRAIAEHFGISPYTVRRHTSNVLTKLGLSSRGGVALALLRACAAR